VNTREGHAVANLMPAGTRLGVAKSVFAVSDIDEHNDEIVELFTGGTQS
jgi:hypothetical protein